MVLNKFNQPRSARDNANIVVIVLGYHSVTIQIGGKTICQTDDVNLPIKETVDISPDFIKQVDWTFSQKLITK
jgi:hypothetical protein